MSLSPQLLQKDFSLYIHLPWCLHKCPYCDFNSHATQINALPEQRYIESLITDLQQSCQSLQHRKVKSIFIGGGTPSLFSPAAVDTVLTTCKQFFALTPDCEITLETNPGTFEFQKFAEFFDIGINRLSIGVQSFDDKLLQNLERIHASAEAISAIETARAIGFTNINIDLMFGLPEQTSITAGADILQACEQQVDHISYYQLTLEPNTKFYRYPPQRLPDEESCWQMQCNGVQQLHRAGYHRYEVSAYAKDRRQCQHNLNYWQFGDYLGVGAGAHSKITTPEAVTRHQRTRQPESYMNAVGKNEHIVHQRVLTQEELVFEFLLNNLRLVDGFQIESFSHHTGLATPILEQAVDQAIADKLLEIRLRHIRATETGYRFLDELLQRFLPTGK